MAHRPLRTAGGWPASAGRVLVVVGPGEEQLARRSPPRPAALPAVGTDVDVAGLAGVLVHLAVLVGNDSGPAQLAVMVGVPVVALFGPTNPVRTGPRGVQRRGQPRARCAPCRVRCCPVGNAVCLRELPVERVERAVLGMLDGG